jgi:hypothetical protein
MRSTCKHCNKPLIHTRAGAQYHPSCRVAAFRARQVPPPRVTWYGEKPTLTTTSRALNGDGTPSLSRAELAERLLDIAEVDDDGAPKTGRRFYYLALSHGYISLDMGASDEAAKSRKAAYKRVTDILGVLRKQGRLGWDMVLDLTRELDEWQTYASPREARAEMRRTYSGDLWLGQPFYPILVVEKDTMEPVCKPMAQRWQMPFASSRGYGSLKLQHDVAESLIRRNARTGQPAKIYFVSDLDPSGLDLQRVWQGAMEGFNAPVIEFVRIGLTLEQVDAHDLGRFAIAGEYGDRCWETDVLPASIIEQTINADIRSWLDTKLWNRRLAEIKKARRLL